jgi:hypothetical protein
MKNKLRWSLFWALTAIFIVAIVFLISPAVRNTLRIQPVLLALGISLLVLGGVLIYLTIKEKLTGLPMVFMLLTGASASGITVSIFLHNVIYGLFIYWFGPEFWNGIGLPDEPVFFFLGLIFFPIALLVGITGTVVLMIKHQRKHN